jgi:hypothetical protein
MGCAIDDEMALCRVRDETSRDRGAALNWWRYTKKYSHLRGGQNESGNHDVKRNRHQR